MLYCSVPYHTYHGACTMASRTASSALTLVELGLVDGRVDRAGLCIKELGVMASDLG